MVTVSFRVVIYLVLAFKLHLTWAKLHLTRVRRAWVKVGIQACSMVISSVRFIIKSRVRTSFKGRVRGQVRIRTTLRISFRVKIRF